MKTRRSGNRAFCAALMLALATGGTAGAPEDFRAMMSDAIARMHVAMQVRFTGDADRDFARMMVPHHQGAIDMSQMELQSGKDPKMRAMAKRIIDAQKKEIREFEQWLGAHK